jgi:hypothetical protein
MSSITGAVREWLTEPERRRSIRLIKPRAQLTLAAYLIVVSIGFGLIKAFHGWSAYGVLLQRAIGALPAPMQQDILDQTRAYANTSLALLTAYMSVMVAVSIGYLHRLLGPIVALERYLRSIKDGNYSARLSLRKGDEHYADLAQHLNDVAAQMRRVDRAPRADD